MNTKTMEGLIGARTNMDLVNTPMRVYKEARRKGDLGTMERAMGYVNDFEDKADDYKTVADEGMKEEAKDLREKEKLELEETIEKRREERKELEEKTSANKGSDTVEISEEGKALLDDNIDLESTTYVTSNSEPASEPVIYTSTGNVSPSEQNVEISVSV